MYKNPLLLTKYAPETLIIPLALLYTNNRLSAVIIMVILLFIFRKGTVKFDPSPNILISPAEGVVDNIFTLNGRTVISIFLNPIDRHFQICPVDGIVKDVKYIRGKFNVAFNNVHTTNERVETIINNRIFGDVKVVQIAGYLFRRITNDLEVDQYVKKADIMGLIKFSSKVTVSFPVSENIKLNIKKDSRIKLGETIAFSK